MALESTTPQEPAEVLEALQAHGVTCALVTHSWAEEYDTGEGTARMAEVAREHPELMTCAVLVPELAGVDLPNRMAAWGARAVRLRPDKHSFCLAPTVCDGLLAQLEEMAIPVLLALAETGWEELDRVLARHPGLRLVLEGVGYRHARSLHPMLERHAGLRVSTASLVGHRALETVVADFGPDRLLFGTGFPETTPGPAVVRLLMAELDAEAKRAIGSANLLRLLGEKEPAR